MKIFLDTANLDEIQQASDFGLLDGITTNPTLAAREGRPFRELILKACEIVKDGIVNAEVVSTDTDGMLREGRELASWHSNIVVKVPMTPAGVRDVFRVNLRQRDKCAAVVGPTHLLWQLGDRGFICDDGRAADEFRNGR